MINGIDYNHLMFKIFKDETEQSISRYQIKIEKELKK